MTDILSKVPKKLLINGEWRDGSDGDTLDVFNPANEEVIATVAGASLEDAKAAVDAADGAFADWAATPPRERGELLRRAFEMMHDRGEEFAELMTLENGKTIKESRAELAYAAEFFRWFSEEAVRNVSELFTAPSGDKRVVVVQQPVGISVLVTPWNFPAAMPTRKIGPALAAGCPVILKPPSETPLSALLVGEVLQEAGCPPGLVNIIPATSAGKTVSAMMEDPRVRKISFTGSTHVGRILLGEAAKSVMSSSMELGGNAPFIVCADADMDQAVEGAMVAKMRNGGQSCTAANRFLVHKSRVEEFGERMAKEMKALKVGDGLGEDVDVGPMINKEAVDSLQAFVKDAVDRDAEILCGGNAVDGKGYFFEPTVLTGVSPESDMACDEIFGPIAPIYTFEDEDEAIEMANDTEYGLIAFVFTEDMKRGMTLAERIESGMVGLNRGLLSDPAAPFGGVKQSGLGREGAHDGLLEFLEKKYIGASW